MGKPTVDRDAEVDPLSYTVETDDGEVNVLEHTDGVTVTAGKKIQLEKFEPIEEQVSLELNVPDGLTVEQRAEFIQQASRLARDNCEVNVARRYEEHVRRQMKSD